jgi:hypothetical protein
MERFTSKIHYEKSGCWTWTGATTGKTGYGRFWYDGERGLAHRFSHEYFRGPIGQEKEIDHLCRNRLCVNPDHLEEVTHKENMIRGDTSTQFKPKTHCKNGHPLAGTNVYFATSRRKKYKFCRACHRNRQIEYRRKKKDR